MTGGSAGANLYAAVKYAKKFNLGKKDKMVIILPDCIRHYLDNFYSDNWMAEKGLEPWSSIYEKNHLLSKIPLSKMKLKEIPLFDTKAKVGDVLKAMSKGAKIIPVATDDVVHECVL